jgi:outer membrane protein W
MKKIAILIFFIVFISGSAFTQISLGGGLLFDMSFGNGYKWMHNNNFKQQGINNTTFGGFVFFDYRYIEVDLSFGYGMLTSTYKAEEFGAKSEPDPEKVGSILQLSVSAFGKFPIDLGVIIVFPLVGLNYNMVLSMSDTNGNNPYEGSDKTALKELSQFGFLFGAGLDFPINEFFFLRAEVMFNLRLANKANSDAVKFENSKEYKTTLGMGPRVKLGAGFRL